MTRDDLVIAVPAIVFLVGLTGWLLYLNWQERPKHVAPPVPWEAKRVWFWRPEWYWFGWGTLSPFHLGHDEFAHRVLVFGWTFTGRILIAAWGCGDPECEADAERYRREYLEESRG